MLSETISPFGLLAGFHKVPVKLLGKVDPVTVEVTDVFAFTSPMGNRKVRVGYRTPAGGTFQRTYGLGEVVEVLFKSPEDAWLEDRGL